MPIAENGGEQQFSVAHAFVLVVGFFGVFLKFQKQCAVNVDGNGVHGGENIAKNQHNTPEN